MRKNIPLLLSLLAVAVVPLDAVKVKYDGLSNRRLFGIEMPTGMQSFYGRHENINSVSLQEYQAGPYSVTEVTIDMTGSPLQLRIYHTEMPTPADAKASISGTPTSVNIPPAVQKAAEKGTERANKVQPPVIKDYPITTHAKTLEFRVNQKEELLNFYVEFVRTYTGVQGTGATGEDDKAAAARKMAGTIFLIE